jgi:hypothetical protein
MLFAYYLRLCVLLFYFRIQSPIEVLPLTGLASTGQSPDPLLLLTGISRRQISLSLFWLVHGFCNFFPIKEIVAYK